MSSNKPSSARLTQGTVPRTLLRMALPMLGGTFAMNAFNLADTWYVAQLGTLPLAAMGFSFPVVMFLVSLSAGLGIGAAAVVSHALGAEEHAKARRLTTHTLILVLCIVTVISVLGLCTIDPLFRMLGAGDEVMPLVHDYMVIWYLGVIFMLLPMTGANILRATGDTVVPSMIMAGSSVLNMILDPIMIFGFAGFPAMGIRGAALATVITRAFSCAAIFWVLNKQHHLIAFERISLRRMLGSWGEILKIGLPSSLSSILMPISGAVITWLVAQHGPAAVAAVGAAGRLEMFAFMVPMALGISLVPFVGQNYGAKRMDRVKEGQRYAYGFAFAFGVVIALLFAVFAEPMARIFSDDAEVIDVLARYLRIVSLGYGLMEIHRYSGLFLSGLKKPMHSFGVNLVRLLVLLLPLSLLGSRYYGLNGIFWARAVSDLVSGGVAIFWSVRVLQGLMPDGGNHPHLASK